LGPASRVKATRTAVTVTVTGEGSGTVTGERERMCIYYRPRPRSSLSALKSFPQTIFRVRDWTSQQTDTTTQLLTISGTA
jgi:hypothetical protein